MSIKHFPKKIIHYASLHKILSAFVIVILLSIGYGVYKKITSVPTSTRYVLSGVERGILVASITGSGQVSVSNQIDLKPKASGDVTWVGVKAGSIVRAGQALASIDDRAARQTIADAESSIAEAKLQYQKDSAQAPIDYEKSVETLDDAKTSLVTTYNDTFNTLSNTYIDLPATVIGMQNILYGYDVGGQGKGQWNIDIFRNIRTDSGSAIPVFADISERDYKIARAKYDQAVLDYKTLTRYSEGAEQEKLLALSIDTTTAIAQALQSELNLLDAVVDDATTRNQTISPTITSLRTNARNYLSTVNSDLSALLAQKKSLDATKKTIRDNERSIEIYKIGNTSGNNPISLQSSAHNIANDERNLQELKDDLSNYTIFAPFTGTIATLNLKKFDTVSTGSVVASLITNQKIAEISLNEIDVARVKVGQKVTLTFDAVEGLSITGSVSEVDTAGTVSQGVVTYGIKIIFDTQDERVKSGMSVSASVITDVRQDVLLVPNGAIKSQGDTRYVEVFAEKLAEDPQGVVSAVLPTRKIVLVGISNDISTEITEGLKEGDQIIVRTILGQAQTTTTSAPSLFGGGNRSAGGAIRAGR